MSVLFRETFGRIEYLLFQDSSKDLDDTVVGMRVFACGCITCQSMIMSMHRGLTDIVASRSSDDCRSGD